MTDQYMCSKCGKGDVRLYRVGGTIADILYCQACSEKTSANLVPAIVVGRDGRELLFVPATKITAQQLATWKRKKIF